MIKLRDYCIRDVDFVKTVLLEVQNQYEDVLPGYINGLGRYFDKKDLKPIGDVRIIEYMGEEVGWLSERPKSRGELYISHFYIHPNFQGKGLGSKILSYYPRVKKNLGMTSLLVDANVNMPEVIDFYKKNSFEFKLNKKEKELEDILGISFIKLVRST